MDFVQLIIPKFIQEILDSIKNEVYTKSFINQKVLIILLLAVSMFILRFFWRYFIATTARSIEKNIRRDLYKHIQSLSFSFFNRSKTGDLMALLINDLNAVRMATGPAFIGLTDAVFMGSLTMAFMLSISIPLTFISITPLVLIMLFFIIVGKKLESRFKNVQSTFAKVSDFTQEIFSGIRIVKGFHQEKQENQNFYTHCQENVKANISLVKLWGFMFPFIRFIASLSLFLFLTIGGIFTIFQKITLGQYVSFTFYINNFIWPMIATGWVFNLYQRGMASSKRILNLFHEKSEITEEKINSNIKALKGDIKIKNLCFSYENNAQYILNNINLDIPSSSSLGILGKPGSGKSTLISLLFRLFLFEKGRITIDGYDLEQIPLKILRSTIGYVPQDSFLFSDSIKNNISFGLDLEEEQQNTYLLDKVEQTAKQAAIYKDILSFPDKFETIVGERGITLSGGQRQRTAIARALMMDPGILILDDALSSVDTNTEKQILNEIRQFRQNRTTIIIAHRISTIQDCDNIIVLENGKIIEQGQHEQLLQEKGYYENLFQLQSLEQDL